MNHAMTRTAAALLSIALTLGTFHAVVVAMTDGGAGAPVVIASAARPA